MSLVPVSHASKNWEKLSNKSSILAIAVTAVTSDFIDCAGLVQTAKPARIWTPVTSRVDWMQNITFRTSLCEWVGTYVQTRICTPMCTLSTYTQMYSVCTSSLKSSGCRAAGSFVDLLRLVALSQDYDKQYVLECQTHEDVAHVQHDTGVMLSRAVHMLSSRHA